MRPKKQKNTKEHKLKKGYGNKISIDELADLTALLIYVEENSNMVIDDCTYNALTEITHEHYIEFMDEFDWMDGAEGLMSDDDCIAMMEYLFKDIPPGVDVLYDFYG